jgi:hypothetical protein
MRLLTFISLSMFLTAGAALPSAVSEAIAITQEKVYLMALHHGQSQLPFGGALFCPVKGGVATRCKKRTGGYIFGAYKWDIHARWIRRDKKNGVPGAMFDGTTFKNGGQYVFVSGSYGQDTIDPNGVTYSFYPKAGTVFVIPAQGQSMSQAVKTARKVLRTEYGADADQLDFQPIGAVTYDCTGNRKSQRCATGGAIDPTMLHRTW